MSNPRGLQESFVSENRGRARRAQNHWFYDQYEMSTSSTFLQEPPAREFSTPTASGSGSELVTNVVGSRNRVANDFPGRSLSQFQHLSIGQASPPVEQRYFGGEAPRGPQLFDYALHADLSTERTGSPYLYSSFPSSTLSHLYPNQAYQLSTPYDLQRNLVMQETPRRFINTGLPTSTCGPHDPAVSPSSSNNFSGELDNADTISSTDNRSLVIRADPWMPGPSPRPEVHGMQVPQAHAPYPHEVVKNMVASPAVHKASMGRRKVQAKETCPHEFCGQTFTTKHNLKNHINSHSGARLHQCGFVGCLKSFVTKSDKKRHEKIHSK